MDDRERVLLNVAKELLEKRQDKYLDAGDWAHLSAAVAAYGERVEWRNPDELDDHGEDWCLDEESPEKMARFR